MRSRFLSFIFFFIFFATTCAINYVSADDTKDLPPNHVIVYYFHGNFRCSSCRRIEQYTKEAVENFFKSELNSGELVFKATNVEKKENKHFVNDYQLYTRSAVVSLIKSGKEVKYKNLTKVWDYLRNKQLFYDYIETEVAKYLKEAR